MAACAARLRAWNARWSSVRLSVDAAAGAFPLLMYLAVDAVLGLVGSTMLVMPAAALPPS